MEQDTTHEPIWIYPKDEHDWVDQIITNFHIHPITAQTLASRGFDELGTIHQYLYAKLPDLHEPKTFLEMPKAVERIATAREKGEKILIYGDNDVDGMTGTALLAEFFQDIGIETEFYIPNQSIQKQNLYTEASAYGKQRGCSLLITVDCGITAIKEIQKVVEQGMDVIITDHHEPASKLPKCYAILNPKLVGQTYENRELTGVGVAFKLAHAITNHLVSTKKISARTVDLKVYLDLVALGTIADMGVLLGENRILVSYGLRQLRKTERMGLIKLFDVCGMERNELSTLDIASKIAPRMNSLGRVADPRKGVEMLLVRDEAQAEELAKELDLFNIERQKIEQVVYTDVEKQIAENPQLVQTKAIVLSAQNWHPGVIPIISSRIAKQYSRPTVIIAIEDGIGKGSLRTIREFPLLPVLHKCADLFLNYGGHDFAAGLTILEENIPKFTKRFIHAANSALKDQDLLSKLYLDAPADFKDLNYDLLSSLELFEPFGHENLPPVLYCTAVQVWPPKVIGGSHLKLYLEQGDRMLEAIAFGMSERRQELRKKNLKLEIAYTPQINRFHNKSSIQLLIRDFKVVS